jgi:ribosomal protein S3
MKQFSQKLFSSTKTQGVVFTLRGKISATGDAKKKHVTVKYGKHSNTTKSLKVSSSQSQVKTRNGVMGISYSIYF